jgi:RNA-directed DNA polymerase
VEESDFYFVQADDSETAVSRINSSRAFSQVRDYLEMKIHALLTRRKRRQKTSIGWRRWSNAYVYGVLGLYWDWKIHPLPGAATYVWKWPP